MVLVDVGVEVFGRFLVDQEATPLTLEDGLEHNAASSAEQSREQGAGRNVGTAELGLFRHKEVERTLAVIVTDFFIELLHREAIGVLDIGLERLGKVQHVVEVLKECSRHFDVGLVIRVNAEILNRSDRYRIGIFIQDVGIYLQVVRNAEGTGSLANFLNSSSGAP